MASKVATASNVSRNKRTSALLVRQFATEIQHYCRSCPHAMDSLDGIAWWLAQQHYAHAKENLPNLIQQLVKSGVLKSHVLQDGSTLFACGGDTSEIKASTLKSPGKNRSYASGRLRSTKRSVRSQ